MEKEQADIVAVRFTASRSVHLPFYDAKSCRLIRSWTPKQAALHAAAEKRTQVNNYPWGKLYRASAVSRTSDFPAQLSVRSRMCAPSFSCSMNADAHRDHAAVASIIMFSVKEAL